MIRQPNSNLVIEFILNFNNYYLFIFFNLLFISILSLKNFLNLQNGKDRIRTYVEYYSIDLQSTAINRSATLPF